MNAFLSELLFAIGRYFVTVPERRLSTDTVFMAVRLVAVHGVKKYHGKIPAAMCIVSVWRLGNI